MPDKASAGLRRVGHTITVAIHDFNAIWTKGEPPQLSYASEEENLARGLSRTWYDGRCGTYDTTSQQCDEYPFYSTAQAGPGASLLPIDKDDNMKQGRQLSVFYTACGLNIAPVGSRARNFLVVPVTSFETPTGLPTTAWCGL